MEWWAHVTRQNGATCLQHGRDHHGVDEVRSRALQHPTICTAQDLTLALPGGRRRRACPGSSRARSGSCSPCRGRCCSCSCSSSRSPMEGSARSTRWRIGGGSGDDRGDDRGAGAGAVVITPYRNSEYPHCMTGPTTELQLHPEIRSKRSIEHWTNRDPGIWTNICRV